MSEADRRRRIEAAMARRRARYIAAHGGRPMVGLPPLPGERPTTGMVYAPRRPSWLSLKTRFFVARLIEELQRPNAVL